MTKSTVVVIHDDLTGKEISQDNYRPVTFSLEGKTYAIDTTHDGEQLIKDVLAPFIAKARVVPVRYQPQPKSTAKKIREWARSLNRDVPERGRLPQSLIDEYEQHMADE